MERPFRVPAVPWLPAVAIAAGAGLSLTLLHVSVMAWITTGVWFVLGGGMYLGYARDRTGPMAHR